MSNLADLELVPDRLYSLYEGMGGLCLLLLDMMAEERAEHQEQEHITRFPLYTFGR